MRVATLRLAPCTGFCHSFIDEFIPLNLFSIIDFWLNFWWLKWAKIWSGEFSHVLVPHAALCILFFKNFFKIHTHNPFFSCSKNKKKLFLKYTFSIRSVLRPKWTIGRFDDQNVQNVISSLIIIQQVSKFWESHLKIDARKKYVS